VPNVPSAQQSFWTHPMELLGDVGHVESIHSICRQCYYRCKIGTCFALDIPYAQKSFWTHLMVPLGDKAQVEPHLSPFKDSANHDAR
jgi:hypothetical protein